MEAKLRKDGTPDRRASGLRAPRLALEITCGTCSIIFSSTARNAKYCSSSCRERARYIRNYETRLNSSRQYRKNNADKIRKAKKERYNRDREKILVSNRVRYLKNRDEYVKKALEYQKANPLVVSATRISRLSRLKHVVTKKDLLKAANRQINLCYYCKTKMTSPGRSLPTSLQWDHVVPLSRGGSNSIGNIVAACRSCNSSKSAMLLVEWNRKKANMIDIAGAVL